VFVHREERDEICPSCLACRTVVTWAVGAPFESGWRFLPRVVDQKESIAQRELFDASHAHRWAAPSGSRRSLLWGSAWHAHPSINRFVSEFEHDADFRRLVHDRIRSGSLTRLQAMRLAEFEEPRELWGRLPAYPPEERAPSPPGLDPADAELLVLGREIFDEANPGEPPQDWWWHH
jgi:hypothetical protein